MFTFENFKMLTEISDRKELISAVTQIPEEDLRSALVLILLSWNKYSEINNELWRREHAHKKLKPLLNLQRITSNKVLFRTMTTTHNHFIFSYISFK